MLILYRENPERRASLFNLLAQSIHEVQDASWPQYALESIYAVDSDRRPQVLSEAARHAARWQGVHEPPFSEEDFIKFVSLFRDLPDVVESASQSRDSLTRFFVLRIIQQLAYDESIRSRQFLPGGGLKYEIPVVYRLIVDRAKSDPALEVRSEAAEMTKTGGIF
jgi:hypothetical protein